MKQKTQLLSKSLIGLLAFSLIAAGCTKKRDATLSDKDAPDTFAISEFGEVQDVNSPYTIQTDSETSLVNKADSAKADNEVGKSQVSVATVPARLQFMFGNLLISGQGNQNLPITFGVEKDFVTAYKIVTSLNGLSAIEKEYAVLRDEVVLGTKLAKAKSKADRTQITLQLRTAVQKRDSQKLNAANGVYLIPIFKYAVAAYGTVLRVKNEIGEETSSLTLQKTEWAQATHLQISARTDDLSKVQFDPNQQDEVDRTFAASKLDRKIMTAADLKDTFQVPTSLEGSAIVMTNLDDDGLHIDQITQYSKLDQSQKDALKLGGSYNKIVACPTKLVERLAKEQPELQKDCVIISRFVVPVKYVKVKIPLKDGSDSQTSRLTLDEVNYSNNVGLVSIPKNVQPKRIQADDVYDSTSLLRVSDFRNKEFFFRRTLEDAPQTASFMIGEAGGVQIVKFEMQNERLVVRRAENLINFNGKNDLENEDLMSIPVTYLRRELRDARGNEYAYPKLVSTNKESAEYVSLKWSDNKLPAVNSPVAYYGNGSCFKDIADTVVQDVDNRFDKGVMNFTFGYSVSLARNEACIGVFDGVGTYSPGDTSYQLNARLKERVSFKLNDGSTDKSYVPQTPFRAQNALGYGVWTMGKITPDVNGVHGREGSQVNLPVVQDFRNGRVLVYTLTGMPADAARKKLYVETVREIVEAWNSAYKRAFKGTSMERNGNYLELQVSGENGLDAHIGDLDRNIIHFDNKLNENSSTLGVSQVGVNERSGVVVADSLIIFAGNLEQYVGSLRRNLKIANDYKAMLENFKKQALEELKKSEEEAAKAGGAATPAGTLAVDAKKLTTAGAKSVLGSMNVKLAQVKNLKASEDLKRFIRERQALGKSDKFKFGSSQMENSYVERVFRKAIETSDVDDQDLEGLVAQEMLVSLGGKLSAQDKAKLQHRAGLMNARNQMKAQFKNKPGCMLTMRDSLGKTFVEETFEQTFKKTLYFDLGHEMGHSQGLTHNFIGSFDRANFVDEGLAADVDASTASRNYSSIMDYFSPPQFKWDGIGSYDVAALRASHTGLFELSASGLKALSAQDAKSVVGGKYVHINTIQKFFATSGWSNFTADKTAGLIRPYKYCTDIDVGYEPVCQRFDLGTTAAEVMDNLIQDYEESYINNYHAWDRLEFGIEAKMAAVARTQRSMISMRQFLDETFYKAIVDKKNDEMSDYAQASVKAYLFLNQLIHTPDASTVFMSKDRFKAVTVDVKGEDGKVQKTVAIVEKRALSDIQSSKLRYDTLGIELDKVLAMQVLTLKGLGYYKYDSASIEFSYLDFEKYLLGMTTDNSLIVNTMKSMFLDKLQATVSIPGAPLQNVDGLTASTSSTMRAYAGISSVLALEASTLKDKDNFANLFKVASVIGTPPSDRISLTQLGVSNKSQMRLSYYALDNASVTQEMLETAAKMDFILRNEELDQAFFGLGDAYLDALVAQVQGKKDDGTLAAKIVEAKAKLVVTMIAQNKNGGIMSEEQIKANPALSMENLSNIIDNMIKQVLGTSIGSMVGDAESKKNAPEVAAQVNSLADQIPLFGSVEKALIKVATAKNIGNKDVNLLAVIKASMTSSEATDLKYGIIMKNIEFLNKLTRMTNPEYSR